jgi:plastocyanin
MKILVWFRVVSFFMLGSLMGLLLIPQNSESQEKEKTGTIIGIVEHPLVKKFPVVVSIEGMPGKEFKPPETSIAMDQKGKVFIPYILPVLVGTKVDFLNNDSFDHNVFSPDGEKYDLGTWGKGEVRSYQFKQPGVYTQLCSIHPEMVAYVVVLKAPYFAVADSDGKFKIVNVPVGTWKLKVWNERFKKKQLDQSYDVKVEEGKETSIGLKP